MVPFMYVWDNGTNMPEHRIRLDNGDLAQIEKALILYKQSEEPGIKEQVRIENLLNRFRRTRVSSSTGRPATGHIPTKEVDGTFKKDWKGYLEEVEKELQRAEERQREELLRRRKQGD